MNVAVHAPDFYTYEEGGSWLPWTSGAFDPAWLDLRSTNLAPANTVMMGARRVHSLGWGMSDDLCARWDCTNGWTRNLP